MQAPPRSSWFLKANIDKPFEMNRGGFWNGKKGLEDFGLFLEPHLWSYKGQICKKGTIGVILVPQRIGFLPKDTKGLTN